MVIHSLGHVHITVARIHCLLVLYSDYFEFLANESAFICGHCTVVLPVWNSVYVWLQCLGFHQYCCIQRHCVPHGCSTFACSVVRPRHSSTSKDKSRLFRHAFWTENVKGILYTPVVIWFLLTVSRELSFLRWFQVETWNVYSPCNILWLLVGLMKGIWAVHTLSAALPKYFLRETCWSVLPPASPTSHLHILSHLQHLQVYLCVHNQFSRRRNHHWVSLCWQLSPSY